MVRAYAWRMTVERLFRILISAIRKHGFVTGHAPRPVTTGESDVVVLARVVSLRDTA